MINPVVAVIYIVGFMMSFLIRLRQAIMDGMFRGPNGTTTWPEAIKEIILPSLLWFLVAPMYLMAWLAKESVRISRRPRSRDRQNRD